MANDHIKELQQVDFFKTGMHPEYIPFVGKEYDTYRVLQVGESHYINNRPDDKPGTKKTLEHFEGWWEGKQSDEINELSSGWYKTNDIVQNYMDGNRTRAHGIFTNVLKVFCEQIETNRKFEHISQKSSKNYELFAYMNFFQIPSIYHGKSFTYALYAAGKDKDLKWSKKDIDDFWYKCMENSVAVFEKVVDILKPNAIIISSNEVAKYYKRYGSREKTGNDGPYIDGYGTKFWPGKLCEDERMIYVSHPGSSWWNRQKKGSEETSKEILERRLREIYKKN